MSKNLLFVFNPLSGKGKIRSKLVDILDVFTKAGYRTVVHPTQAAGEAGRIVVEHAGEVERIVASGGDGTLDEVVSALQAAELDTPIGYIPSGSTNDFAKSLHIPKDLVKAAEIAATGDPYFVDIGSFNEETFVYVAAFGLFTDVAYKTNQSLKKVFGYFAYLMEAGKRILKIPRYHVHVEMNGETIDGVYAYGMVTNAHSVGGLKNVAGDRVDLRDGLFEVTLVHRPKNPLELSEILAAMLSEKGQSPLVETYKTDEIRLVMKEDVPWTLDGEYGGEHREVCIRNLHEKLHIYLPSDTE